MLLWVLFVYSIVLYALSVFEPFNHSNIFYPVKSFTLTFPLEISSTPFVADHPLFKSTTL